MGYSVLLSPKLKPLNLKQVVKSKIEGVNRKNIKFREEKG